MDSGRLDARRFSYPIPSSGSGSQTASAPADSARDPFSSAGPLDDAIRRTREYLLSQQHEDGYWVGELEGDTILESEFILLLAFLGRVDSEQARRAAAYICAQQIPDGAWSIYPGGPIEISASVKAYFALKLTGHDPAADYMVRAREAILAAGGAERVNSFTRFYLALLGILSYDQCPAVPPEITLIPHWMPFNVYEMSAWSRTIIVPLSIMWAYRPAINLPDNLGIRELFVDSPENLPMTMGPAEVLDDLQQETWLDWGKFFRGVDLGLKALERLRLRPLRRKALKRAASWIQERFDDSDGLGAIFPPIIWSIIALKCLGHDDDSAEVQRAFHELEKLTISEGDTDRLQPCKSPVWDTAITTIALRDAGVPAEHPAIRDSVTWLLSKECRRKGDWSVAHPTVEPSGWFFEFNNAFYPDVDDTGMVVMALTRSLPGRTWDADFRIDNWSLHEADKDVAAILSGSGTEVSEVCTDIEVIQPMLSAIHRGARWIVAMQSRDGGWGAFDSDNTREVLTRVPFADHNAMIDPSSADLTARMLEMFADLNLPMGHPVVERAIEYVWQHQEDDHCWYGRWGVHYLYGTWQAILGMVAIGISPNDDRIRKAAGWLKSKQASGGGWGETPRSYDDPTLRGQGEPTASQTAWALMGLVAAGDAGTESARRGAQYLMETQKPDGTWDEEPFTGTGFPKVFYLKYHMYRIYFPLMALSRYARAIADSSK